MDILYPDIEALLELLVSKHQLFSLDEKPFGYHILSKGKNSRPTVVLLFPKIRGLHT